jgi:fructokinase
MERMSPEPRVLVVGEALIDIVMTGPSAVRHPGGSPANVSYGLGRLGASTTLLTWFGRDASGEVLMTHLESAGVKIFPGSDAAPRTSTAVAHITEGGSAEYQFDVTWNPPQATDLEHFALVHTGSIASFLSPGAEDVREMLSMARTKALITYDPNIRPKLVGSHSQAVHTFEETIRLADVVKLSHEDAAWLYPDKSVEAVLDGILAAGASLGVATMGSGGSVLVTPTSTARVPAKDIAVVDTIGAGDAYMSALLVSVLGRALHRLDEDELWELGEFASIAAAITVGRAGAVPPTRAEMKRQSGPVGTL